MKDPTWYTAGRLAAWLNAVCLFGAALIRVLINLNLTAPSPPSPGPPTQAPTSAVIAAFNAYRRAVWPQEFVAELLFAAGLLSLIVIALALRELFGHSGARQELMAAALSTAAVLGVLAALTSIARIRFVAGFSPIMGDLEMRSYELVYAQAGVLASWLAIAFLFLVGVGAFLAGQLAFDTGRLLVNWGRLSGSLGLLAWVGVGLQFAPGPWQSIFLVLTAGIVAPLWSLWLALELTRQREVAPAPA